MSAGYETLPRRYSAASGWRTLHCSDWACPSLLTNGQQKIIKHDAGKRQRRSSLSPAGHCGTGIVSAAIADAMGKFATNMADHRYSQHAKVCAKASLAELLPELDILASATSTDRPPAEQRQPRTSPRTFLGLDPLPEPVQAGSIQFIQ